MAAAATLSPEAEQSVAQIVWRDFSERYGEAIRLRGIRIVPAEDRDGEPYHHIVIVYSGQETPLDPAWLNGFQRRNREGLARWGITLATESYVDELDTVDSDWSEMISFSPQGREDE